MNERNRVENSNSRCGKIALGIFCMILPPEICLPNYVMLSPILKISWFPQGISEVKLQRELVEEHAHWNREYEIFSCTYIAKKKKSQSYFNLKEKHNFQHLPSFMYCLECYKHLEQLQK